MKFLKHSLTTLLLGLFIIGITANVQAQDKRALFKTYNKALDLASQGEYEQAINMFNQAIQQAKELGGEDAQNIVQRSEDQLPQIYYQIAIEEYKNFQQQKSIESLDATIEAFRQTEDIAAEYGKSQTADKAANVITQLLYSKSLIQYQQKNYEQSLATLDEVIERNPNYAKAYYQKAIIVKSIKENGLEEAIALFDKAIEVGSNVNASQIVSRAKENAYSTLVFHGVNEIQNQNYDRAIELLNQALTYDSTAAGAHYRLASAYNKTQDWQKALTHAQKGLELESGGKTERAKIYFELATAYQALGQKGNACSAYSNAAYGSFKAPAEHQMEYTLECEATTN
ncbi:MAG TPA: tetratricopeptide repeat protein [Balneolaceae bacterium]